MRVESVVLPGKLRGSDIRLVHARHPGMHRAFCGKESTSVQHEFETSEREINCWRCLKSMAHKIDREERALKKMRG